MPQRDDEWSEEIESHVEMRADRNKEAGMKEESAKEAAARAFGNRLQVSEKVRAIHVPPFVDELRQDLRYAWRSYWKTPSFTVAALIAIALGIGASAAVFSVVDRILFRPLPYANEERLVWFGFAAPIERNEFLLSPDYFIWKRDQKAFDAFTVTRGTESCDLTEGDPVGLDCARVDANFLPVFGVTPVAGRNFEDQDERQGAPPVALMSYSVWVDRYARSPEVIGRAIELNRQRVRIVGVLPESFEMPNLRSAAFLRPLGLQPPAGPNAPMAFLNAFGRLKPDRTIEQTEAELQPLLADAMSRVPPMFRKEVKFRMYKLRDRQTRDARQMALLLAGAVLAVLLIASANVANLLLARGAAREREHAVRAAIGASRGRLIRQRLTESLLLNAMGGVLGIALAAALLRFCVQLAPPGIIRLNEASLDGRVLLAAGALALLCGLICGLIPALERPSLELLGGSRVAGSRRYWMKQGLIVGQIALSLILLSSAAILLTHLSKLISTDLGFRPERLLTMWITLHREKYPQRESQLAFFRELESRVRGTPGVTGVALADSLPPASREMMIIYSRIHRQGDPPPAPQGTGGMVVRRQVTPAYFQLLSVPIVSGRSFTDADRGSGEDTVILSSTLARRLFPSGDGIGQKLRMGPEPWRTVVGVAADVRNAGLAGNDDPEYYELVRYDPLYGRASFFLVIRTEGNLDAIVPMLREQVKGLDAALPVEFQTLEEKVQRLSSADRFQSWLLAAFALTGLVLAAVGIYGVVSFLVTQRTKEMGIRMTLGASTGQIQWLVLRRVLLWTAAGLAIGAGGAAMASRFHSVLLPGAAPPVYLPLAIAMGMLTLSTLIAAWLPAWRASAIDPNRALRHDG